MPKIVSYQQLEGSPIAGVTENGDLVLNKNFFSNLDNKIADRFTLMQKTGVLLRTNNGDFVPTKMLDEDCAKNLMEQIKKYNNGELKSFNEKVGFYNYLDNTMQTALGPLRYPFFSIKYILANENAVNILRGKGILTDLEQIKALSTKEQRNLFIKMIKEGELPVVFGNNTSANIEPFHSIYHELGHLNDSVSRVRAAGIFNNDYSKYPQELKNWVDNQEYIQTAARVSSYARTGPGEFIAETFSKLVQGYKLPDEVLALYKKLGGPAIP